MKMVYKIYFNVLIATLLLNTIPLKAETNGMVCVIRGICGDTEFGVIPCNDKSEPLVLKQIPENIRSLSLLEAMCPHLNGNGDPTVCCDEFQLESMFISVYNLAHLGFNHCPSCLKNLEKLFCQMGCSPNQNQFIKVKKIKKNGSGDHLATEVDYYISETYAKGLFDSCKNVRNFEGKVMDSYCAGMKGDECTPSHWLNHMGTSIEAEGVSPFKIIFHMINETSITVANNLMKPLNENFFKCNEKPDKNIDVCDCNHCLESCPQNREKRSSQESNQRTKRNSNKCLMRGVCGETAFGVIPCVTDESPSPISNPTALEQLKQMCPHLVTDDNTNVCCTEEQIIRLNETLEMVSMFLKECPACVRNFEKVICHLSCGTDQNNFMKITKSKTSEDGREMVSEVQYFVNDDWIKGVYDSCKGVHRLGFNVLDHYCKPFKAKDCDHQKFLQFIGGNAEHYGHNPFEINFVFTNDETVESDGNKYKPVKQSFYKCSDNPHTGEGICPCIHCQESCAPGEERVIKKRLPKYNGKNKRQVFSTETENSGDFENDFCIFDRKCSGESDSKELCLDVRRPEPLKDKVLTESLRSMCPDLVKTDQPMICCDQSYIDGMESAFEIAKRLGLGKCPSCLHNLKQVVCQFGCSPKQNQLIRILNATKDNNYVVINHLEFYLNENFAQTLFDSCKSIYTGKVINMMCGDWGHNNQCTAQRWFDFMGHSVSNGQYSPFQMDIKLTSETSFRTNGQLINPLNSKAYKCNEAPNDQSSICPCKHCPESC